MTKLYLNRKEITEYLGYKSEHSIDKLIRNGIIPVTKLPGMDAKFNVLEVEKAMEKYTTRVK